MEPNELWTFPDNGGIKKMPLVVNVIVAGPVRRGRRGDEYCDSILYMLYADIHNLLDSLVSLERSSREC